MLLRHAPLFAALVAAPLAAQVPTNTLPLRLGADQTGANVYRGGLAAVRLYGRPLTAAELAAQAAAPPTTPSALPGLVREWLPADGQLAAPLSVPHEPGFAGEQGLTLEAWIRPEAKLSARLLDKITPGGTDGWLLDTWPGDALRLIVGEQQVRCPLPHRDAWVHVAATISDAGEGALYVAGKRVAGEASPGADGLRYTGAAEPPGGALTLWYRQPARRWTEALVLGNGRLGAMLWGGPAHERLDLNEDTLWSGEPYDNLNPQGLKALPEIRRLLLAGDHHAAQRLVEQKMNGKYNQSYLPLGDLTLDFPVTGEVTAYRRELALDEAVAKVSFGHGGARYTREVFVSPVAQAVVVRLTCDQPGRLTFNASLGCQLHHQTSVGDGYLRLTGRCPAHADPSYVGHGEVWEDGPTGRGMRFETRLVPLASGGRVTVQSDRIVAAGCDSVTLLLVAATSYNGPHKSPSREGKDPAQLCDAYLRPLAQADYTALRAAHVAEHRRLFDRVALDLGHHTAAEALPTDRRLRNYDPLRDPGLAALYYQFGRYLLISSSRPGGQPANLQGLWNHEIHPPWSANWTLNCNAQINYWPVEQGNLAECHLPLIELTEQLSEDGAHIAKELYGVRGWVAHHNTDIWRQAGPVSGSALWSIFQVGGAWLCQHLWEHYAFSGDREYLARVWPTLKGAARFYLDYLMEEPTHKWLVTGPDTNFENGFRRPNGDTGCVCLGPTASMQMVRELLTHCAEATTLLGTDADLRAEIDRVIPRLPPMQISPTTGELQEWLEDWQRTAECQVLSSWGAICANQIDPRRTPELAAGLRKIFDKGAWWQRGQVGTWQGAFQINAYTRLHDAQTALAIFSRHINTVLNPNLTARFTEWQIDGNLGNTAALAEMLLQSQAGELELLPALPQAWPSGSVRGLRARGGFEVDVAWADGQLTSARGLPPPATRARARYGERLWTLALEPGKSATVRP